MVEVLLDSRAMRLVMSSEFAKKQCFKLKKLERPMNIRNVDGSLNKEEPIENMVEVNIYYKRHRERTEIDVIRGQKWTVVRCSSHQGGSPQNGLGDEWTCGTTLASAYVLCRLSAAWSQL